MRLKRKLRKLADKKDRISTRLARSEKQNEKKEQRRRKKKKEIANALRQQQMTVHRQRTQRAKSETKENRLAGFKKLAAMLELATAQASPIIFADDGVFKKLLHEGPRPYNVITVFTALDARVKCPICAEYHQHLSRIAESYKARYGQLLPLLETIKGLHLQEPSPATEADLDALAKQVMLGDADAATAPLFFVVLDMHKAQWTWQAMGFSNAPNIYLFPSTQSTSYDGTSAVMDEITKVGRSVGI